MPQEKVLTYTDLGFNSYGLNTLQTAKQIPASLSDYILEVAENAISDINVKSISADKLSAGTMSAVTKVGDDSIVLDGEDKTIKIFDGAGNVSVYMKGGSA